MVAFVVNIAVVFVARIVTFVVMVADIVDIALVAIAVVLVAGAVVKKIIAVPLPSWSRS